VAAYGTPPTAAVGIAERPGPRPTTMALGAILFVVTGCVFADEVLNVSIDGGVVLIGLMIGVGILFLIGSRRN
jgi:hypothetical protein